MDKTNTGAVTDVMDVIVVGVGDVVDVAEVVGSRNVVDKRCNAI